MKSSTSVVVSDSEAYTWSVLETVYAQHFHTLPSADGVTTALEAAYSERVFQVE
jgi:hypothetical protein